MKTGHIKLGTLRYLLLALAESWPHDISILGPLADFLEEQGDPRANYVASLSVRHFKSGSEEYWYVSEDEDVVREHGIGRHLVPEMASEIIAWRVLIRFTESPAWQLIPKKGADEYEEMLLPTLAEAESRQSVYGPTAYRINGPVWD